MTDRRYRFQPVKPLSQFRKAIQLFNDEYKPRITKAEARSRVRLIYPDFV
jgi:hypothetical protein